MQVGADQAGEAELRHGEVGGGRLGIAEVGSLHYRADERRPPGIGSREPGVTQFRSIEARPTDVGCLKAGAGEVRVAAVGLAQIGPAEVGIGEGDPVQRHPAQRRTPQIDALQFQPRGRLDVLHEEFSEGLDSRLVLPFGEEAAEHGHGIRQGRLDGHPGLLQFRDPFEGGGNSSGGSE